MSDKEIEVNGKKYGEDTRITLKAKTLIWVIGVLVASISTLATIGYFDIKSDVSEQKEVFEQEKTEYMEDIHSMIEGVLEDDRKQSENMIETIGEMKGDIKVILDRTSRNNNNNNNNNNNGSNVVNNNGGGLNIPTNNTLPVNDRDNTNGSGVNNQ